MLIGGFIRRCQTVDSPLLDLSLFKLPFVVASNLSGVLFSVGFIGMWLLNTTWLQEVWDYSVVRSGLATFPGPAMAALVAPFAGKYATKLGHARVLFVGAVMLSFGTFMLAIFMTTEPNYVAHYLPWMVVTGIGVGLSISTLSSSATAFLPPSEFAMGSALNTTTRQIGTALGSAIALTVAAPAFKQVYELGIRAKDAATTGSPLVWAEETAKLDLSAYHTAWIINGVVYFAAGILMIVIYRKPTNAQMISAGSKITFED
jgi:MFS family permease